MTDLIKADLFFFIASLSVIGITFFLIIICAYVIKILHDVRSITRRARKVSGFVFDTEDALRENVKRGMYMVQLILADFFKTKKKRTIRKKIDSTE